MLLGSNVFGTVELLGERFRKDIGKLLPCGALPYMRYVIMWGPRGYGISAVLVTNRVFEKAVMVIIIDLTIDVSFSCV